MKSILKRLPILPAILLILVYSSDVGLKSKENIERQFKEGIKSLSAGDYIGAINIFSYIYASDPESYYGELSYLYLGKTYALYFYSVGERSGIRSTIAFLNNYFYEYKTPRFSHLQKEFIGDCYYMIGWYKNAKAMYESLYEEKGEAKYLIKFALASAIMGSLEGYTKLLRLKERDIKDIKDLYYSALGYFMFNLEEYKEVITYLSLARSINPYLENDPAFLYRLGASYYKTGDLQKAIFYLELASKKDYYGEYKDEIDMYLVFIYLDNKNYKDAFDKISKYLNTEVLFSNKVAQHLYASLWMYYDFLEAYKDLFKDYKERLRDIAWLNIEESTSILPILGIYFISLKERKLEEEDINLMKIKVIDDINLKGMAKERQKIWEVYENLNPEVDFSLIVSLYKANKKSFESIFDKEKHKYLLVKALLNGNYPEGAYISKSIKDEYLRAYFEGIYAFINNERGKSIKLLKKALKGLKSEEKITAMFLIAYLNDKIGDYEKFLKVVENVKGRSFFKEYAILRLADKYFEVGNYKRSKFYYKKFIDYKDKNRDYYFWWAMFRMGRIGELTKDMKTIKWVVKKAKETNNIWSEAILAIWG